VAGEVWVAVLGIVVALLRGLLSLPGTAFVAAVSWLAIRESLSHGGGVPGVLATLAQAWATPRFRFVALGLWLAGALLWGALRVAWVAGAAPILAWRMSGRGPHEPRFSEGAALRFHRVLPTAVAAFALDLAGRGMLLAALFGAFAIGARIQGTTGATAAAFVAALGLTSAAFLSGSLSTLGDVAVARAAMAGEGPGSALRRGLDSFLRRPAAFLLAILVIGLVTVLAAGSAQGVLSALGVAAHGGPRALLVLPNLLLAALAGLLAAGAELWRLAAVGALSLSDQSGEEKRWMSFRSESLGIRPPSQ